MTKFQEFSGVHEKNGNFGKKNYITATTMFQYLLITLKRYMNKVTTKTKQQSNCPSDKLAKRN